MRFTVQQNMIQMHNCMTVPIPIQKVELTQRSFEYPNEYDFEKVFNRNFGVIKEEAFDVVVDFSGWSAAYVAERIWSTDQKIIKRKDGSVRLKFSASSEPELIS